VVISTRPAFDVIARGLSAVADFMEEHRALSTALVGGVAIVGSLGLAVKGLSLALGMVKSGFSTLLSPLKLFKREAQSACAVTRGLGPCLQEKGKLFSRFSLRVGSLTTRLRSLAGASRFLLGGLRLLGSVNPFGLALTGISIFAPKLWSLIGGVEGLKKAFSGVKEKAFGLGGALLSGIKDLPTLSAPEPGGKQLGIEKEMVKLPVTNGMERNTVLSPNITITIPAVNVYGGEPEDVKEAVIGALREGGTELKEAVLNLLKQLQREESPII
jgi:hypothetical protein